ncbi:hypothetical protein CH063_13700, partial [Colletotrichum higginsianum]
NLTTLGRVHRPLGLPLLRLVAIPRWEYSILCREETRGSGYLVLLQVALLFLITSIIHRPSFSETSPHSPVLPLGQSILRGLTCHHLIRPPTLVSLHKPASSHSRSQAHSHSHCCFTVCSSPVVSEKKHWSPLQSQEHVHLFVHLT